MQGRQLAVALLLIAACGTDSVPGGYPDRPDAAAGADADVRTGIPCEVRAVIAGACAHCHSSPTSADAPMPLLSRTDFLALSSVDGENVGQRSLGRLHETQEPMPPRSEPALIAPHLGVLEAWLTAGMPAGECEPLPAKPLATTCASNSFWTGGDDGSADMNPGRPCVACHYDESPGDAYFFAGTVFTSFHGEDLCNTPPPSGARIEILDMQGNVTQTMTPRGTSGNFHSPAITAGVALPYRARLVANGLTREMRTPQMSGDCNSCHTEQGTHTDATTSPAPGRLVWPSAL